MTDALEALKRPTASGTRPVIDTAPEKPHRCLSHLHWFARDRDLAWEHAWLALQKLGGTDSAELAMARLRTLLLHSPGWRTGQPTHRPPFCRLRRLLT